VRTRDPGGRAPERRRQQVAREDEQRPPHGELLDEDAVVVHRTIDMLDTHARNAAVH